MLQQSRKLFFVKGESSIANQPASGKKAMTPVLESKVNKFVSVCHFCNRLGHIRPKCYKYKKKIRMNKIAFMVAWWVWLGH